MLGGRQFCYGQRTLQQVGVRKDGTEGDRMRIFTGRGDPRRGPADSKICTGLHVLSKMRKRDRGIITLQVL